MLSLIAIGTTVFACGDANHLGHPVLLPASGIFTGIENASYAHKRAQVKTWIVKNERALRLEGFEGPVMAVLLADVPEAAQKQVRKDLKDAARFTDFAERATLSVMVHQP
ncbi:MAG: hypothetical protein ACPGVK_06905 [Halocynthiibacter sp.]